MGVMSRQVVPACSNLCNFCPSLRARSRQPVKRYKKLLADILPRNQEAEPNDRKIGKLCDYASKNPLRIPKITEHLEQRCYKDLRNESFGSVKVVICVYRKLLSSCKEHMPLFAGNLIGIIRTLLEQDRQDDMRILGCNILVEFISSQRDSTYMFNLEGLILKLCQLAQEAGSDHRAQHLRSAGLQALASMVLFMGQQSHISMEFDKIISVTLENYVDTRVSPKDAKEDGPNYQRNDLNVPSLTTISAYNSGLDPAMNTSKSPTYWSRICLCNMARLAKEATTVRRVLEPLFHNFDSKNQWSLEKGLAYSVLTYMQELLEESGDNSHLLLSILVKHLDHKSIAKQPRIQIDIVNVITLISQNVKKQSSVPSTGAITDLIKLLRKCVQNIGEVPSSANGTDKENSDLLLALENCISQLSKKVGDAGLILDKLAVVLENIPTNTVVARATIAAIFRAVRIISCVPNVSYHKKAFPDGLFHQLLLIMSHPDQETRVGAHNVLSMVLMPSILCPWIDDNLPKAISWFSSVGASQKWRSGSFSIHYEGKAASESINGWTERKGLISDKVVEQSADCQPCGESCILKHTLTHGKTGLTSLRLSSHQVNLLLSLIWVQATSAENTPATFEAMAHTYSIALLFIRSKTSSHMALVRCFQLALSLKSFSLDQEGGLRLCHRRCLFTLALFMLLFSAKMVNLPELIPMINTRLTENTVDPYLQFIDGIWLQAVSMESGTETILYGSEEDEVAALKFFSMIELDEHKLKETVISHLMTKYAELSEAELLTIKEQLLEVFSPDESYSFGAPLFMETPWPCSPLNQLELPGFDEAIPQAVSTDDETFPAHNGSYSDHKTSISINSLDVISVNQLLESVLETARQVASFPVSSTPVPYDEMKSQCEALVTGKQQKMTVLHSFKDQQETKAIIISSEIEKKYPPLLAPTMELSEADLKLSKTDPIRGRDQFLPCSSQYGPHSFRLPPSSPYDKFLKAAGC